MTRTSAKGKARRVRRANNYKSLNLGDPSRPVVLETCVPRRIDVTENFLVEGDPNAAEKYFRCKHDLVEAVKKAKRVTKAFVKLGAALATDELQKDHEKKLEAVFNFLNKAEDFATVRLDEIFVSKPNRQ